MVEGDERGARLGRVLEGIERVFAQQTEREPSATRIQASEEVVSVLMEDVLTPGERGLAEMDGGAGIRQLRWEEQEAMRDALIAVVEDELGQEVIAFMSASHVDPDYSLESFVLAPRAPG